MKLVDPDDVAALLECLYSDRAFRAAEAQKVYENARRPAYNWDRISKQWDELLQAILAKTALVSTDYTDYFTESV